MQELRRDLDENEHLGHFSRKQRTAILNNWIFRGDKKAAEEFLHTNGPSLNRPWWLWSLLRKEQAKFEEAVNHIRSGIEAPSLPKMALSNEPYERLKREFSVAPGDIMKGTALLHIYIEKEDYQKIREITGLMISTQTDVPLYVSYWNAESHVLLNEHIEGWFAYERYLKRLFGDK